MGASDDSVSSISGPVSVPCLVVSLRPGLAWSVIYVLLGHMLGDITFIYLFNNQHSVYSPVSLHHYLLSTPIVHS